MFRIPSIADASAQHPPVAPQHRCAIAPAGSTNPVAVEARDGATLSDVRFDRGHWSFDPEAYRIDVMSRAYSPSMISSVLVVLTCCCCFLMVAIALGAK